MSYKILKKLLNFVRYTPLHPQWIVLRENKRTLSDVAKFSAGKVLDIGCGQQAAQQVLSDDSEYIGLDYLQTASEWYNTRPQIYGDAQQLPFKTISVNTVLLLDVLEHLPSPASTMTEIKRVLKPNGTLIVQVPFLYPVHDAPLDFQRWTEHGLQLLFREHGFETVKSTSIGAPVETAALISCIALSKHTLNWFDQKNPLFLFVLLLPIAVLIINCCSWLVAKLSREDALMPAGYRYVLRNVK